MSDINVEKDDLATQEMLDMMGDLSEGMEASLEDIALLDADDLLASLSDLPELDDLETGSEPTLIEADATDDELISGLDELADLDTLMASLDNDADVESAVEVPVTADAPEAASDVSLDAEGLDVEDLDSLLADTTEALVVKDSVEAIEGSESSDDLENLDDLVDLEAMMAESPIKSEPSDMANEALDTEMLLDDSAQLDLEAMAEMDKMLETDVYEESNATAVDETDVVLDSLIESDAVLDNLEIDSDTEMTETPDVDLSGMDLPDMESIESAATTEALDSEMEAVPEVELEEVSPPVETTVDVTPIVPKMDESTSEGTTPVIEQTGESVMSMEDAIQIDQDVQEIAEQVKHTAQEATQLALETSRQAQASAERTQQAIERTFVAAERAFEAAKKAGYSIDLEQLDRTLSSEEVTSQLTEIRATNSRLKDVNQTLKNRISDLKS